MSARDWLLKHYPVPADDPAATASDVAATEHGLLKWEGTRRAVLEEHGLRWLGGDVVERTGELVLATDADTCALCARHVRGRHTPGVGFTGTCDTCPIAEVTPDGDCLATRERCCASGDPEPMIDLLRQALVVARRRGYEGDG